MKTPVIKEYKEFSEKEKEVSQNLWVKVLNTYCRADEEGCRPCDYGCPCDRCHYDPLLQKKYSQLLVERGVPITPSEAKWLAFEP